MDSGDNQRSVPLYDIQNNTQPGLSERDNQIRILEDREYLDTQAHSGSHHTGFQRMKDERDRLIIEKSILQEHLVLAEATRIQQTNQLLEQLSIRYKEKEVLDNINKRQSKQISEKTRGIRYLERFIRKQAAEIQNLQIQTGDSLIGSNDETKQTVIELNTAVPRQNNEIQLFRDRARILKEATTGRATQATRQELEIQNLGRNIQLSQARMLEMHELTYQADKFLHNISRAKYAIEMVINCNLNSTRVFDEYQQAREQDEAYMIGSVEGLSKRVNQLIQELRDTNSRCMVLSNEHEVEEQVGRRLREEEDVTSAQQERILELEEMVRDNNTQILKLRLKRNDVPAGLSQQEEDCAPKNNAASRHRQQAD